MGFRINTNVTSLQAQTSMKKLSRSKEESLAKLSSGERINKAADDAAGLAISENLKAQIRSSKQAGRNANDGISIVQVAEGGLSESSQILTRLRELAVQAASDTLSDQDRSNINLEYRSMIREMERISQSTEYNGQKLLNGSGKRLDFQVGVGENGSEDVIIFNTEKYNSGAHALGVDQLDISSKFQAQQSLGKIDSAFNKISTQRADIGSIQSRLQSSTSNLDIYGANMSAANNRIRDLDYADETANNTKLDIVSAAGVSVMAQANNLGNNALKLLS